MTEPDIGGATPHVHGEHVAGKAENAFTHKFGPLPGWAWGLIVVGLYVGYRYYQSRTGGAVADPNADPNASGAAATSDQPAVAGTSSGTVTTGSTTGTNISTNAAWAQQAELALGQAGTYGTPLAISTALSDYLNGNVLTTAEQTIVNAALSQFGPPPEGILPSGTGSGLGNGNTGGGDSGGDGSGDPTGGIGIGSGQSYTIQAGDTLGSIVNKFYPNAADRHEPTYIALRAANPVLQNVFGNDSDLSAFAGQVIIIPNVSGTGGVVGPITPTKPPVAKPKRTYVIKSGDTLGSVMMHFYGAHPVESEYVAFRAANPHLAHVTGNSTSLKPYIGQTVVIP